MQKNINKITAKQLKVISIIIDAKTISEGTNKALISRKTFYNWLKNPIFKAELARQRREVIDLALDDLKGSVNEAVNVLKELLKAESESVRLKTATGILEYIHKSLEFYDIEERLELLESKIEERNN